MYRSVYRITLASLVLCVTMPGFADQLSDPTRPWDYKAETSRAAQVVTKEPTLYSTMISPERRIAVIDGEVVQEGERFGDLKVISIRTNQVRLRGPKGYITLKLLPAPIKRAAGKASE